MNVAILNIEMEDEVLVKLWEPIFALLLEKERAEAIVQLAKDKDC